MEADPALVAAVTSGLAEVADPSRAPRMQAYMRSAMPFLGVAVPAVRTVVRSAARAHAPGRRASIIARLGFRSRTDVDLLTAVVDANAGDPDFFVRRAIGWALRDHGTTDPGWVRSFVAARELSPLSRREATRRLG